MRFQPKTENEIAESNLLPAGVYGFEIMAAEDQVSHAGNDMIKLSVHVFEEDGTPRVVYDYLMEKMAYKLRHAAEVCGLMSSYDRGELSAMDFIGKTGRCKVIIQKSKDPQFPDKNAIGDYLRETAISTITKVLAANQTGVQYPAITVGHTRNTKVEIVDDEIPF